MKNNYIFFLIIIFLFLFYLSGCEYKSGLGITPPLPTVDPNSLITGWRITGGILRPRSPQYSNLTGEVKIIRHQEDQFYLLLSDDFKASDKEEMDLILYLTQSTSVSSPSALDNVFEVGRVEKNGFQYFYLKDETGKWINPLNYQTAVLFDPKLGVIAGTARLSKTEPFEESFWLQTHSEHY